MPNPGINSNIEVLLSHSSFHLYQLQKVDFRLDQINLRLDKISAQLANNPKLREAEQQVKADQELITQNETALGSLEQFSKNKKIKIEQSEASLYNGKNSNPKELKDLQIEIESLKRAVGSNEEEQLTLMALLEELHGQLQQSQSASAVILAESEQENQHLVLERTDLEKEKEKLFTERQAATSQIQPADVAVYESLRSTKNHIAVTVIEEQCCTSCGSEIRVSDVQKARASSTLSFCPFCGRILYAG
jgi:predicted  nucleic acid-binding Zn-ribbon protein